MFEKIYWQRPSLSQNIVVKLLRTSLFLIGRAVTDRLMTVNLERQCLKSHALIRKREKREEERERERERERRERGRGGEGEGET